MKLGLAVVALAWGAVMAAPGTAGAQEMSAEEKEVRHCPARVSFRQPWCQDIHPPHRDRRHFSL